MMLKGHIIGVLLGCLKDTCIETLLGCWVFETLSSEVAIQLLMTSSMLLHWNTRTSETP